MELTEAKRAMLDGAAVGCKGILYDRILRISMAVTPPARGTAAKMEYRSPITYTCDLLDRATKHSITVARLEDVISEEEHRGNTIAEITGG